MSIEAVAALRKLLAGRPLTLEDLRLLELAGLADVPEGAGEGRPGETVLEHTQQVLNRLQPSLQKLPPEPAQALYLAALLHEIGQGRSGRGGRATSHEHSGAALARDELFRLDLPGLLRDQVVYLVRLHTAPVTLGRRSKPARMLRLAWTLDTHLLYLLARADCETSGLPAGVDRCRAVTAFRERCAQLGILGREPPPLIPPPQWQRLAPADPRLKRRTAGEIRFWRLKSRLQTTGEAIAWLQAQQPAPAGTLYLPVGVPGSGKSTWVGENLAQARLISMDELREALLGDRSDQSRNALIFRRAQGMLAGALRAGETAVWDAQSHTWNARQGLLKLAREVHAYVIMIYFDVPLEVALERNRRRAAVVPEEVIRRSYAALEEPRPFEAEEIWRVDVNGQCTRYLWDETTGA